MNERNGQILQTNIIRIVGEKIGRIAKEIQPRSQGLSSSRPLEQGWISLAILPTFSPTGGGKMRDPGNEVEGDLGNEKVDREPKTFCLLSVDMFELYVVS